MITAVVNQKGGVGKTTTAMNLGVELARRKRKVLLLDLDPQAALTTVLGVSHVEAGHSAYEVLVDRLPIRDAILRSENYGLWLLPGSLSLAGAEVALVSVHRREEVLRKALATVRGEFDHVLIDCAPSLGMLTINALTASDRVLIPVQTTAIALRGIPLLWETLEEVRRTSNPGLQVLGVLPTLYDGRTRHAREVIQVLGSQIAAPVLDVRIKFTVQLQESLASGIPVSDYAPGSEVARAYARLAEEVDRGVE